MCTLRVMSRPGRITQPGHVMPIVRTVVGAAAVGAIGRVRMLADRKAATEVRARRCLGACLMPTWRSRHTCLYSCAKTNAWYGGYVTNGCVSTTLVRLLVSHLRASKGNGRAPVHVCNSQ